MRPIASPVAVHEGSLWRVGVHMHQWGRSAEIRLVHADGGRTCLLDVPQWDVDWQGSYALSDPVETAAGDRIELTCEWANRDEDQPLVNGARIPVGDVTWGLDALHEMCEARLMFTGTK